MAAAEAAAGLAAAKAACKPAAASEPNSAAALLAAGPGESAADPAVLEVSKIAPCLSSRQQLHHQQQPVSDDQSDGSRADPAPSEANEHKCVIPKTPFYGESDILLCCLVASHFQAPPLCMQGFATL
jgi:hypothetical protein